MAGGAMIDRFEPPYNSFSVTRGSQQCANRRKLEYETFAAELLELTNEIEDDEATEIESTPTENVKNIIDKPDLANADLRHAAQDAITKARDISKAEIDAPGKLTAEAVNSGTHASIGVEATPCPALSTTATDEETAEDLVADYYFPACTTDDDLSGMEHGELVDELESLIDQVKQPDDYLGVRDQYCRLAEELNLRGLLAPAFRSDLKIPWKPSDRKPAHTLRTYP